MATHYQVLGVHSKADTASIRAAYLKLIKRHHPDSGASGASDVQITDINLAYSVLRDTGKRAQYDARLLRQSMRSQPVPPRRYLPPAKLAARWRRRSLLALRIAGVASALAFVVIPSDKFVDTRHRAQGGDMRDRALAAGPSYAEAGEFKPPAAWELDSAIEDVVKVALAVPLDHAREASVRCYDEARNLRQRNAADRCVAFDLAISYWQDGGFGEVDEQHYFERAAMRRRHSRALAAHDRLNADARLQALDYVTMAALVDALKASQARQREAAAGEDGWTALEPKHTKMPQQQLHD